MDRDEILRKSRSQKEDEGMTQAENRGRKWGWDIMYVVFGVLLFFNICVNQQDVNTALWALMSSFFMAETWSKFFFTKEEKDLWRAIFWSAGCAFFIAAYIWQSVRG